MRTRVRKWGNSLAVRIPSDLAQESGVAEGSEVYLVARQGRLVVTPARPRIHLSDLIRAVTASNLPDESWDDPPRGREAW